MAYYLVFFTLNQNYFDAAIDKREDLTKQEIAYGIKLFKIGVWQHAYATPGNIKSHSWAIYRASSETDLEKYLEGYPMGQAGMYKKTISEVMIVDPPWIVGLLFKVLRLIGFFRPPLSPRLSK